MFVAEFGHQSSSLCFVLGVGVLPLSVYAVRSGYSGVRVGEGARLGTYLVILSTANVCACAYVREISRPNLDHYLPVVSVHSGPYSVTRADRRCRATGLDFMTQ